MQVQTGADRHPAAHSSQRVQPERITETDHDASAGVCVQAPFEQARALRLGHYLQLPLPPMDKPYLYPGGQRIVSDVARYKVFLKSVGPSGHFILGFKAFYFGAVSVSADSRVTQEERERRAIIWCHGGPRAQATTQHEVLPS